MFVVKSLSARNVHRCDKVNQFLHGSPSLGGSIFWKVPVGCYLGIDMFINSSLSRINMASQKQTVKEIVCKAYPDQYLLMVGHGLIWWWFNVPGQQGQASVWVNLFRRLTQAGIVLILQCRSTCWSQGCISSEDEPGATHGELISFWNNYDSGGFMLVCSWYLSLACEDFSRAFQVRQRFWWYRKHRCGKMVQCPPLVHVFSCMHTRVCQRC